MSTHGFGFSSDDDDDEHRQGRNRDNNENDSGNSHGGNSGNPFEGFGFGGSGFSAFPGGFAFSGSMPGGGGASGPGLGDILSQFGQMLSGMGSTMNSPDARGAVNFALAERIARQKTTHSKKDTVRESDRRALEESARLVEMWLATATALPADDSTPEAWSASQWLERTLPTWKRFISPVAESLSKAQQNSLPEEAREMAGPIMGMVAQMGSMNMGMQLGQLLGDLATKAVSASEWGIPLTDESASAILTGHLDELADELGQPKREVLIYICARELAHRRLFRHAPWLDERLVLAVEAYSRGLSLDTSGIEEAMRSIDPQALSDPARMQEAMGNLQNMDLTPKIVTANENAGVQLATLLSLIEGWVDTVVAEALFSRIPVMENIQKSWSARRVMMPGVSELTSGVGLDFSAEKADKAAQLWSRLTTAVGSERRDHVWDHPDFLPVAADIENPAEFIDSILGENDDTEFNPISEIEQLEKELNSGEFGGGSAPQEKSGTTDPETQGSADGSDQPGGRGSDADGRDDTDGTSGKTDTDGEADAD